MRRVPRAALSALYALYAWVVVVLVGVPVWLLVAAVPGIRRRWAIFRGGARLLLLLSGARPVVEGRDHVPGGPCVVVANHTSPLDALAVTAALPGPLVFVAAGEFAPRVVAGGFLRRIEAEFVERTDRAQAARASDRLVAAARRGSVLVFFPEGRMSRAPGLQPFRMGAFAAAAAAGIPVVPIAIAGTRQILRPDRRRPRPGRIRVVIGGPITTRQPGWTGALELRNAARGALVSCLPDPDLEG